ncbi:MAG TPA: ABC transporter substrate-binding protein [Candidatus Binataceae bacterium]
MGGDTERKRTKVARPAARVAAAALWLTVTLASACSRSAPPVPPGFIQVDIETSPSATDPRFSTDATSSRVNELVFDSLLKVDRDGQFIGDLADSFARTSPTELVFHLRHGIRFSDGRELTARDVKFTYDSILAPANLSPRRAAMVRLASIDARDPYTVVMTMRAQYAPALELGMQGIVPAGTAVRASTPRGSGPFMLTSFARDEAAVLERNPYRPYSGPLARGIVFKVVPDPTVRALELAEGVCDFAENNLEPYLLPYLIAQPGLEVSKSPGNGYRYLSFNFRDSRLKDVRVRRAIAYAIDRAAIVTSVRRGTARVATGMLSPENWAYDGDVKTYSYDPARAAALLEEAGYPRGAGGMRNLAFVYKTTPDQARLGEVIQAMLARVGIRITVRTNEFATFYSDIQNGNFDLTSMNWVGINDPNHYYMVFDSKMIPPAGYNRGAYANPAMDRLVEAGAVTLDPAERKTIYTKVQQLAAEELPYVSLWWDDTVVIMNRRLAGFQPYPNGSLRSLATVTLAGGSGAEPSR